MHIITLFVLYSNKFFTVFNDSCTRSAARDWNNAKRFLVAFSQSWNRFYLKSFKEPYISDVHTEGGLVIIPMFADSIVFKIIDILFIFADGELAGRSRNWSFFVDVGNVWPPIINNK